MQPLRIAYWAMIAVPLLLSATAQSETITIAHVYAKSGPLEAYARQSHNGLMLGLEYATNGTFEVDGRAIEVIEKDTGLDPAKGRSLLEEAYADDNADLAVGPMSSNVALAMLPVAEAFERILIVEPAMADAVTGADGNRYVFRTGRNATQDAVANAVAIGRPGVKIATLAQDDAYGRGGIAAFRDALAGTGADLVHEAYVPTDTTDFTAVGQRIFDELQDAQGDRVVFFYWAGAGKPIQALQAMNPERHDIRFAASGTHLSGLVHYKPFVGLEGATYYYHETPDNDINQWLVEHHLERFGTPPDFFAAGGMVAGIAAVEAIRRAGSTDTEELITTLEGMHFDTPKGEMMFRPEDHQALQSMYHFRLRNEEGIDWAIPELVRELTLDDIDVPLGR